MFPYTGEYEEHTRKGSRDFTFYTFTPRPLCDGGFFSMDEELAILLADTHRHLGMLEGVAKYMPDSETIRYLMLLQECHYSMLIDYEAPQLAEILKLLSEGHKNADQIKNIMDAYKYSSGQNINNIVLTDILKIALHGVDTINNVAVREEQTFLGGVVSNSRVYNPTAPLHILPAVADISKFLTVDTSTDVLIKAALAHYQFEMIHPYESYNGIIGRIMISMILQKGGFTAAPLAGLSKFLYWNKNEYFETLRSVQRFAGYIAWIKFFVTGLNTAAKYTIGQIEKMQDKIIQDELKIEAKALSKKNTFAVYDYFKKYLTSEIRPAANALGLSYNTVAKSIQDLLDIGVLERENQQSRHRKFSYRELLAMIDE